MERRHFDIRIFFRCFNLKHGKKESNPKIFSTGTPKSLSPCSWETKLRVHTLILLYQLDSGSSSKYSKVKPLYSCWKRFSWSVIFFVFTVFLLPQHLIKASQCSLYRRPDQNSMINRILYLVVKDLSSNSFSA